MKNKIYINGRFLTQEMTGVQRVATQVSLLLQQYYKDRLIFLCPDGTLINPDKEKFNIIRVGKLKGYLWEQFELPKYLQGIKPNLLLNFCNTAPILYHKNIIVIHDMATKPDRAWFDWKFRKVYDFLYFFNIKRAMKIITVSEFSKNEILKYYPKTPQSKIAVIYLASFIMLNDNMPDKDDYFVAVNNLNARKNVDAIVKAFKLLDPLKYKLKIAGGVNKKVFGDNTSENEINIEYMGNVSDKQLYNLLIHAKGFINAAWYEGFGLPPLEAMSLKTPCILSDIPVYRELYNETALFFNPARPEELAQKVAELYNYDKYESLQDKSFNLSQQFSWEKAANEYINIINKYNEKN